MEIKKVVESQKKGLIASYSKMIKQVLIPNLWLDFTNQEFPIYDSYGNVTDWGTASVTIGGGVDFYTGSGLMVGFELQPDYWANLEGNPTYAAFKVRMGYSFSKKM